MPKYLKAYHLKDLRQFPGWKEPASAPAAQNTPPTAAGQAESEDLNDETVVFVHENFVVTKSCFDDKDVIFDAVSPEWQIFCKEQLSFEVPNWEEEAARVRAHLAANEANASPPAGKSSSS